MESRGRKWTDSAYVPNELNTLHFTAVTQVDEPAHVSGVRKSEGHRAERIGSDAALWSRMPECDCYGRGVTICELMFVGGPDDPRGLTVSVPYAAIKGQGIRGK